MMTSPPDAGMTKTCHYCGGDHEADDLRPYGPGGSTVCFPCMKATPEREQAAASAYGSLLDAAGAISPVDMVVIGEADGPRPVVPS